MNELRRRVGEGEIVVVIEQDATSDLAQTTFERASRAPCIAVTSGQQWPHVLFSDVLESSTPCSVLHCSSSSSFHSNFSVLYTSQPMDTHLTTPSFLH